MKNIIFINGTMGVGKTSTSRELQNLLPRCVFLDGDWCWDMKPFTVTDETKAMVEDNIKHTLNNFLKCSEFENIIFCWVMHQQYIIDDLISGLDLSNAHLCKVSLICSEQALTERISGDIRKGKRSEDVIARSIPRLKNYERMDTIKIDTSNIDAKQAAQQIADYIREQGSVIKIAETDPNSKDAVLMMDELSDTLEAITGNSGRHSFDTSDVCVPRSIFAVAYDENKEPVGCGAIRPINTDIAELKRMYAKTKSRGVGTQILNYLEAKALELGYSFIRLETRLINKQAVDFYEKNGYHSISNYGKYADNPEAVCFEKNLAKLK